jgi:hypothetical protein
MSKSAPVLERDLTTPDTVAILPNDDSVPFEPMPYDQGAFNGRIIKLSHERRRLLLALLVAEEDFLGMQPRTCKHCGRPVR